MEIDFTRETVLLKALADETRAKIAHILSCGELCACDILDYFEITQPTLSHHLGILVEAGLVTSRPDGKWTHYSLDADAFARVDRFIKNISRKTGTCLCKKPRRKCT